MNWNDLYIQGINLEMISKDSEEYQTMFAAAVQGDFSAQYYLGLWNETVDNKPDVALKWFRKAAEGLEDAAEAVRRLGGTDEPAREEIEQDTLDDPPQLQHLVIKEHNFQEAKNSLRKYTEATHEDINLSVVPRKGGLFNLATHKVEGDELNKITSQIQDYLIKLNDLSIGLVDELGQVYKAFEYLDRDYIAGIVAAIKSAEKVSEDERKDRKDIKELVDQHELSVKVLKKFKADIEKLKHITDVDKAWELIEEQAKLSKEISDFVNRLAKLKHLNDIDALWEEKAASQKEVQVLKESLERQAKAIAEFAECIQGLQNTQKQYEDRVNQANQTFRESLSNQAKALADAQTAKLSEIANQNSKSIAEITTVQTEKLNSIEEVHKNTLASIAKEQAITLARIEKEQKDGLTQLSEKQAEVLEQLSTQQRDKLAEITKSYEEEKLALNAQISNLTQKVKIACIVAGGAGALALLQLLLNVLGVM